MGALTSNRKRRDGDFVTYSYPIDELDRIAKKPKLSSHMIEKTPDWNRPTLSKSVASIISKYPEPKLGLRREVQGPVRRRCSFSKRTEATPSSAESQADEMGLFGFVHRWLNYRTARSLALNTIKHVFPEKQKDKEVIVVDSDDEDQDDVSDDSSIKHVDNLQSGRNLRRGKQWDVENSQELNARRVEKDVCSLYSSVVSDVSNAVAKVDDGENVQLSSDQDVAYKRKLSLVKQRDGNLATIDAKIEAHHKRWDYLRPEKKEVLREKSLTKECFLPLSEDDSILVSRALSNKKRRDVLVTHEGSNVDITVEKLQCLRPGAWLNDEVINVYLELLKERERREPQKFLKCHFHNTFFYKKLISGQGGYNFSSVRRWTTQRKLGYSLLECDKIFVPIHREIHWCLAVINKRDKKFQYLDSLGGTDSRVLDVLAKYFVDEVKDKCGQHIDVSSWEHVFVTDLPEQENGYDCGVFMIKYADFYSRDIGLCFSQEHMPYFRKRTAKEILKLRAE